MSKEHPAVRNGETPKGRDKHPYESPAFRMLTDGNTDCEEEKAGKDEQTVDLNIGICPYFMRDRGNGRIACEGASFRFPDKLSRREYLYHYCAHPLGYKSCPLKTALDHYYERKYENHA